MSFGNSGQQENRNERICAQIFLDQNIIRFIESIFQEWLNGSNQLWVNEIVRVRGKSRYLVLEMTVATMNLAIRVMQAIK